MDFFNNTQQQTNPLDFFTNPMGLAQQLFKPSGFDNIVDDLGLGKIFGQTSFETISTEGGEIVKSAFDTFQRQVKQDPSLAMSTLSKELNFQKVRYDLMIRNASSNRTKNGLPISLKAIEKAIQKISEIETNLKRSFSIQKIKRSDSFTFKITKEYVYFDYVLTPKQNTSVNSKTDFVNGSTQTNKKEISPLFYIVGGFFIVKQFFPKLLKF